MSDANKWDGQNRRERERWKVKKEISVADIVSFGTAVLAVIYAYTTLDKRVFSLEQDRVVQAQIDQRQDNDAAKSTARTDARLDGIDGKLDRIMERLIRASNDKRN